MSLVINGNIFRSSRNIKSGDVAAVAALFNSPHVPLLCFQCGWNTYNRIIEMVRTFFFVASFEISQRMWQGRYSCVVPAFLFEFRLTHGIQGGGG